MSHNMILNCFNINYFFLDFGNGYCVEMPSDKKDLDKLLDYLFSQKVEWKFYATLTGRKWFHGMYLQTVVTQYFVNNKSEIRS